MLTTNYYYMCEYQSLFYDQQIGYVIRCNHCNYFQIGYGNLMMNVLPDDFTAFYKRVAALNHQVDDGGPLSPLKSIIIPTPCEGLNLFLSEREIRDLYRMLDEADSEWKTIGLSCLVNRKRNG